MIKPDTLTRWTVENSADLYGIRNWGGGYFDVSEKGEVVVRPGGPESAVAVSLMDIVSGLNDRGLTMPVLLRFEDILDARLRLINESFARAMQEAGYRGSYRGVYPIKVNQQQQVVEEIVTRGRRYHHGLEAGSKAELIAALAYMDDPDGLIVCNGYKDEEFVDLALHALKMGLKTVLVIEMPSELTLILDRARRLNVRPCLGVRYKPSARGGGHWGESAGDLSMFGLTASQIIDVLDALREKEMLDGLQMLHHHIGSQIPNIRSIQASVREAARVYVDLVREGAKMGYLNIGGGLAVDYDGSHTNFPSSSNYTIDEYAADIVEVVQKMTDSAQAEHPVIVSESGRAVVAHHSVLLFNVLGVTRFETPELPGRLPRDLHESIQNLLDVSRGLNVKNLQESYHDAMNYRDEIRSLYEHGSIPLRTRALSEKIFWHIVTRIARELNGRKYVPDELRGIETALADLYHCNFSVFQSLPDSWAIEQLFPVMPVHRLGECPTRQGIITDITCDSDGKIERFVDLQDVRRTLRLHSPNRGEDYYLGVFLVGAYQETLGDLHNLFGDTNVATICFGPNGEIEYAYECDGDTVADVLSYVEYHPAEMVERVRARAERAVRQNLITAQDRREIMTAFETGLRGYTYFEQ
jgi:arginine decarboxylase